MNALRDQSRRPHHITFKFSPEVRQVIIAMRLFTSWGAERLAQVVTRPLTVAEVAKAALSPRGLLTFIFMAEKGWELARRETNVSL